MVKDINPGTGSSSPGSLAVFQGNLYFVATDGVSGYELWKSDGSEAGTQIVKDIASGAASSNPNGLTVVENTLYFAAAQQTNKMQLWKTDGTTANTQLVSAIYPDSSRTDLFLHTAFNGELYFVVRANLSLARDMWKSDGTAAGTVPVNPTVLAGGEAAHLYAGPGKLYFAYLVHSANYSAENPASWYGMEPWITDGTDAGTMLLKDINTSTPGSFPDNFCRVGDVVFFTARNAQYGTELWKTDGTPGGTVMVKDILAGSGSSEPKNLTAVNGVLFFSANSGSGRELWKSDGTEAGTVQVKDIVPGPNGSNPEQLTNANGTLYFSALGIGVAGLWKSDGTEAGTVRVKATRPEKMLYVNGTLFFVYKPDYYGNERLWKSDGTEAGTIAVKENWPDAGYAQILSMVELKGKLYFALYNSTGNLYKLWTSDGTEAGTVPVIEAFRLSELTVIADTLYFNGGTSDGGLGFWKSDGTATGTVLIKKFAEIGTAQGVHSITASNGIIYFAGSIEGYGSELYRTDGTEAGTFIVKKIRPGALTSAVGALKDVNGSLYFVASQENLKPELWKSDGTEAGTVMVPINSGLQPGMGSQPGNLTVLNNTLIFGAEDYFKGREPFRVVSGTVPLSLLEFTAQKSGNTAVLIWKTTNEVNTASFEVERAAKSDFKKIAKVAARNRPGDHHYKFEDVQPFNGSNYYRLKLLDIDGRFTYSDIRRVDIAQADQVRISPNPASTVLRVSGVRGYSRLEVLDISGKVVHRQNISENEEVVNLHGLLRGNYVLRLKGKNGQESLQFVKQ